MVAGATVADWPACFTAVVEGGIERGEADPLGFRAAANRLAGSLFSPITARTTSVRQLGLFMICAQASGSASVNVERAVMMSRLLTVACVHATAQELGVVRDLLVPVTSLPGRQMAGRIAARIDKGTAVEADLRAALLQNERAQGLWGRYATLAERLGFLERTRATIRLTTSGHDLANATGKLLFWMVRDQTLRDAAKAPSLDHVRKLSAKCPEIMAPRKVAEKFWPAHDDELDLVRRGLLRSARGGTVLAMIGAAAQSGDVLACLERDERLAALLGTRGQRVGHLAGLARLARRAVNSLEPAFRAYVRGEDDSCPSLAPYEWLFTWCSAQGLDAGLLVGAPSDWDSLTMLHARLFRRRGRRPWGELDPSERSLIAPRGGPADLRVGALSSLAGEGLVPERVQ